jgi:hypothetical protein
MTLLPQATTYLPVRMQSRSARSGSPGTIRARSGSYRCPHADRKTPVGGYKVIKKFDLRLLAGHPVRYDSFDEGETTPHKTKDANEHKGTLEMATTHKGLRDSREGPEGSHRLPGIGAPIHPLRNPDTHSQGILMKSSEDKGYEIETADHKIVRLGDRVFNYYDGRWGTIVSIDDDPSPNTMKGQSTSTPREEWDNRWFYLDNGDLLDGSRISTYDPKGTK